MKTGEINMNINMRTGIISVLVMACMVMAGSAGNTHIV